MRELCCWGRRTGAVRLVDRFAECFADSRAPELIEHTVSTLVGQRVFAVRIMLRADSGFAREALMSWCEANGVDYLFGLAKNGRLVAEISTELAAAEEDSKATRQAGLRNSPGRRAIAGAASAV